MSVLEITSHILGVVMAVSIIMWLGIAYRLWVMARSKSTVVPVFGWYASLSMACACLVLTASGFRHAASERLRLRKTQVPQSNPPTLLPNIEVAPAHPQTHPVAIKEFVEPAPPADERLDQSSRFNFERPLPD